MLCDGVYRRIGTVVTLVLLIDVGCKELLEPASLIAGEPNRVHDRFERSLASISVELTKLSIEFADLLFRRFAVFAF